MAEATGASSRGVLWPTPSRLPVAIARSRLNYQPGESLLPTTISPLTHHLLLLLLSTLPDLHSLDDTPSLSLTSVPLPPSICNWPLHIATRVTLLLTHPAELCRSVVPPRAPPNSSRPTKPPGLTQHRNRRQTATALSIPRLVLRSVYSFSADILHIIFFDDLHRFLIPSMTSTGRLAHDPSRPLLSLRH